MPASGESHNLLLGVIVRMSTAAIITVLKREAFLFDGVLVELPPVPETMCLSDNWTVRKATGSIASKVSDREVAGSVCFCGVDH